MTDSERTDRYQSLMRDARCPVRHRELQAADLTPPQHPWSVTLQKLWRLQDAGGFLVALLGDRGPGKTQLGVELIRRQCMGLETALYMRIYDLLIDLKSTFGKDAVDTEREVIERFCQPRLLVLDECTERREGDWDQRVLTYICDRRYADKKNTLLIANAGKAEFEASLGNSIVSRMVQTGGIMICNWESFRK